MSTHVHGAAKGGQSLVGQEVLKRHSACIQLGGIDHFGRIQLSFGLQRASSLLGNEIRCILLAVDFQIAIQTNSLRNIHLFARFLVQKGFHEIKVARLGFQLHVGLQPLRIIEVGRIADGIGFQGRWQIDVQTVKLHTLSVATHHSIDQ